MVLAFPVDENIGISRIVPVELAFGIQQVVGRPGRIVHQPLTKITDGPNGCAIDAPDVVGGILENYVISSAIKRMLRLS